MVNSKLKNIIKKLILKEAFNYSKDFEFSDFGDDEKKRTAIRDNYNDRSIDEAYVDEKGVLRDFDFFPYNLPNVGYKDKKGSTIGIDVADKSPFYDPNLPKKNRMKSPDGGVYLKLIISEPHQKELINDMLTKVKKIISNKLLIVKNYGDTLVLEFSNKVKDFIFYNLNNSKKEYLEKYKKMLDNAEHLSEPEKIKEFKKADKYIDEIIKSIYKSII